MSFKIKLNHLWWLFSRQTVSVKEDSKISASIRIMVKRNFRHLPVINDEQKLIGIVSAQDVIDALHELNIDPEVRGYDDKVIMDLLNFPVKHIITKDPLHLLYKAELMEAVKIMSENNKGALPLTDEEGRLKGIITLRDFISFLGTSIKPIGLKVKDFYNKKPICINPEDRLLNAINLMAEKKIRRLLISYSNSLKDTQGMISNKDILRFLDFGLGYSLITISDLLQTKVSKVMGNPLATVEPEDDIRVACFTMNTLGIGGLGVVIDDKIDGVITERDIVTKLYEFKGLKFIESLISFSEDLSFRPPW